MLGAKKGGKPSIEVALATYESARFLSEQLDSLFSQSEQGFTLLVADDGSQDGTLGILETYARRFPGRIRIVARDRQLGRALGNFSRLLEHASADYLFLCDHDDIWLPHKMEKSLARMFFLVAAHGNSKPLLVHTDLTVVDEALEPLGGSMFAYSHIDASRNDLKSLLTANVATGCTVVMNRALYEAARPIPPQAMMHDHWLALVAGTFGAISCIKEPTVLYRQHGGNAIGARKGGTLSLMHRVHQTLLSNNRQRVIRRYSRQAAAFLERYGDRMSDEARRTTATLAGIWSINRWRRYAKLHRAGLGFVGVARNIALFVVVTREPPREDRHKRG